MGIGGIGGTCDAGILLAERAGEPGVITFTGRGGMYSVCCSGCEPKSSEGMGDIRPPAVLVVGVSGRC